MSSVNELKIRHPTLLVLTSPVIPNRCLLGQGVQDLANSAGQPSSESTGQFDSGQYQPGQYDDGQYKPGQYNQGQNNPDGGSEFDDGSYRPGEKVTFPALPDFDFAYAVKDEASGNDYAVNESNKGGAYRVLLPDGRYQVVQWLIDEGGIYRTRISYIQADQAQ